MNARSRYTRAAREDLLEIWSYIAREDVAAADLQIDRIGATVERLQAFPEMGHIREDVAPDLRVMVQDRYLIIFRYRAADNLLSIVRIVHGSRNLIAMFA